MLPRWLFLTLLSIVPVLGDEVGWTAAQPQIPAHAFTLADFGARGDGQADNTDAFRRAIAAVQQAGGGRLEVPAGNYRTGPIDLCSNCEFHLDAGARLLFSSTTSDYFLSEKKYRPLIGASKAHDILISGTGTLDGRGDSWWVVERRVKAEARARGLHDAEIGRPRMLVFTDCQRIRVEDITLSNPPMYHIVPQRCQDVTLTGLKIVTPANAPNTDGIDPSASTRVVISQCLIDTGDDCIAIKAGNGPCRDILITDCTFRHGHGCSIGSDTPGGVSGVLVRRCTFDGTVAGVRLKSARDRGGLVEGIVFRDLQMKNVEQAIVITSYYYDQPKFGQHDALRPVTKTTPHWRGITIANLTALDGIGSAGVILGLPEAPATDIRLENVQIRAGQGLRLGYVDGIRLDHTKIAADQGPSLLTDETVAGLVR